MHARTHLSQAPTFLTAHVPTPTLAPPSPHPQAAAERAGRAAGLGAGLVGETYTAASERAEELRGAAAERASELRASAEKQAAELRGAAVERAGQALGAGQQAAGAAAGAGQEAAGRVAGAGQEAMSQAAGAAEAAAEKGRGLAQAAAQAALGGAAVVQQKATGVVESVKVWCGCLAGGWLGLGWVPPSWLAAGSRGLACLPTRLPIAHHPPTRLQALLAPAQEAYRASYAERKAATAGAIEGAPCREGSGQGWLAGRGALCSGPAAPSRH